MRSNDLKSHCRFGIFGIFGIAMATLLAGCTIVPQGTRATKPTTTFQVPRLTVVLECGQCQVRPIIPTLVVDAYAAAALKAGATIASDAEAVITVKEYSERSDIARVLAGGFAGRDEIRAVVTYREKTVPVEDYYRNSWLGIEDLAETIGEMAFEVVR